MTTERTLIILKPEAFEWHIIGDVMGMWDKEHFSLIDAKVEQAGPEKWKEHYQDVLSRIPEAAGEDLIKRMTRGRSLFLIYEGRDIIARARKLLGATDPAQAVSGTIRKRWGRSVQYNVAHASDSAESAVREIALWFPEKTKNE